MRGKSWGNEMHEKGNEGSGRDMKGNEGKMTRKLREDEKEMTGNEGK